MSFKPVLTIKNYFDVKKEKKNAKAKISRENLKQWVDKLSELGFKEIAFPIFIVYDKWNGIELTCVSDLNEFAYTYSYHYWPLDDDSKLLDRNGNLWSGKYDKLNKTNLPNTFIMTLKLENVKELLREGIVGHKSENELKVIIEESRTIEVLFNRLVNIFP